MLDFINEVTVAALGTDCKATAHWLEAAMQDGKARGDGRAMAFHRAARFWQHADDDMQATIGACIGFTEPTGERLPTHRGIATDFENGLAWAYETIGEPE